ncbi:MAG: Asp-tRNA(Asn)/Glu-tRNA(Gln) amidotransferase subunit GatC [Anaerolineae bacterium]|nr:Asp-tRNA(Asn)/Glu-tRNA(Gln) amidotransferase subunit GatC [Anaerolineae bacterium]
MSLTKEEVEHIALLARLNLSEEEKERYRGQLSSILEHVAQLQELDTANVKPMSSVLAEALALRADIPGESLTQEKLTANAPDAADNQFKVPPVLDNEG